METENNQFDGNKPNTNVTEGNTHRTKKDRYYESARSHETLEAEAKARLDSRKESAQELRQRQLSRLDAHEAEYAADRANAKAKLDDAKLDVEAAHHSASEHCSELGIRYVPGKTTEEDLLKVTLLEDADAARDLGLRFGIGYKDWLLNILKPILAVLCWLMSSLSLGLGFRIVEAKHLFANPVAVGLSLVMGGLTAIGLFVAITWTWKLVGAKVGSVRPSDEIVRLLVPVTAMTATLWLGLSFLDAKAVILLNAARAALNPIYEISMSVALLIGMVISGVYVLGLAVTGFASEYTATAKTYIFAVKRADENRKRTAAKESIPVREALEALADVKVTEEVLRVAEIDIAQLEQQFTRSHAEMMAQVPEVPTTLLPDEIRELTASRDRLRSAKAHFDAHVMSRNGRPETAATEGK